MKTEKIEIELKRNNIFIMKTGSCFSAFKRIEADRKFFRN